MTTALPSQTLNGHEKLVVSCVAQTRIVGTLFFLCLSPLSWELQSTTTLDQDHEKNLSLKLLCVTSPFDQDLDFQKRKYAKNTNIEKLPLQKS